MNHTNHNQDQRRLLQQEQEQEPLKKKLSKLIPNQIKNQFKSNHQPLLPDPNHPTRFKPSNNQRLSKLIIIIISSILIIYNLISWTLDQPNHLQLDPIIDPITFQIKPIGDPYQKTKNIQTKTKSSVSIELQNQERLSNYNLRILHAIHRNITKASKELKNKSIPIHYDPLEETHADQLDPSLTKNHPSNLSEYLWYKGDQGLRSNRPVSRFKCDAKLQKDCSLLFIGIFTTPDRYSKRNLIRTLLKADLPPSSSSSSNHQAPIIDLVFISGKPKNEYWNYLIEEENKRYGNDVIVLENLEKDNIDLGKTYEFFRWVSMGANGRWKMDRVLDREIGLENRDPRIKEIGRPQFVMKSDDDTFLVIPNLIKEFQNLDCGSNIYWGTSQGSNPLFPAYFRGLAYALSWPLVEWIGTSNMSYESQVGIEDARVGAWLSDLDDRVDRLMRIDLGWRMGDWNQLEIDSDTVALHWLKSIEWFPMVKFRVLEAWRRSGLVYRWDWYFKLP
ncbi:family 31 glycosyltransferase [Melampsora larici-populina 98AG31]|uniref:Hexosyltransferase n=1 Tax=Melampsora larici-populina (strain 98AG31 / pathotype 3-4-7) TaxID=747676 RepID=F4S9W6_MELLP|nr:family 31 glycosyltransferase [Melampsora larici-populina 98AG31]XP_007418783.1 family 31 glycosyltransferase [Melampsora larici-populina 98AG31]EGF97964.1 family 31 glycosyltransferase [Melampsora larici-populina 98AG31]EGF98589.1 family 31 glycosyltransferase [Melampsora larici-populina 98AG31]